MLKPENIKNFVPRLSISLFLLILILVACGKSSKVTLTPTNLSADAVNTAAAQTADARRNQTGSLTPTSPPLPTFDATSIAVTQAAATSQAMVTPSLAITIATTPSTPAVSVTLTPALPAGGDNSVFTGKETIPDGTKFSPGAKFTKTWQFMNNGQSTWTTAYKLAFVSGEQMSGPESLAVELEVQPGRLVDISVDLQAPKGTGSYTGYWRLQNAAGQFFGDRVYVQIEVVEQP